MWAMSVWRLPSVLDSTNATASSVVMCSITIFSFGSLCLRGVRIVSINTFSRSKMSTVWSATSPWTYNNITPKLISLRKHVLKQIISLISSKPFLAWNKLNKRQSTLKKKFLRHKKEHIFLLERNEEKNSPEEASPVPPSPEAQACTFQTSPSLQLASLWLRLPDTVSQLSPAHFHLPQHPPCYALNILQLTWTQIPSLNINLYSNLAFKKKHRD